MRKKPSIVVTIGVFDGVHRGHQSLIHETVRLARRLKASPVALTFQDHPLHVLKGGPRVPFLLSRDETFERLKKEGIREVHALRFDRAFSQKEPEAFVQWLRNKGPLRGVVVGEDFRFGREAKGDTALLRRLGEKAGFTVKTVKPFRVQGEIVSSSRVRQLLADGKTERANRMLGWSYAIEGDVVHGKHVGHRLGFPTANLRAIRQFLPKDGVYACAVRVAKKIHRAGMNLGKRPTFKDDDHHRQAEVHVMDYHGRLYGRRMKVYLLRYLRPERKFTSSADLAAQIQADLSRVNKTSLKDLKAT